jgi:hypothetical protein
MTKILSSNIDPTFVTSLATLTGNEILSNKVLSSVQESIYTDASAPTATTNIDYSTANTFYYTGTTNTNFTLNIRGDSSNTFASKIGIGQSVNINVLITNGSSPYYCNFFQIDGVTQPVKYVNGSAIASGNANSIDMYSIYIIKKPDSTYTTLVSQTKFA